MRIAMHLHELQTGEYTRVAESLAEAAERIAPVWPLANFVAVNPFMGCVDSTFADTAQRMRHTHGAELTMPLDFYLDALDDGRIDMDDVREALHAHGRRDRAESFIATVSKANFEPSKPLDTVADVASRVTGVDLSRFMKDQLSAWAAAYFDDGQASWKSPFRNDGIFAAWKAEAEIDRAPEIMGIAQFRKHVASLPEDPREAAATALQTLEISSETASVYLQALSRAASGWLAYAARVAWDEKLYHSRESEIVEEFLAILVAWEYGIFKACSDEEFDADWAVARERIDESSRSNAIDEDLEARLILHAAYEMNDERMLARRFEDAKSVAKSARPLAQAIFCIDVRSEVFRRHLEAADSRIETLGFAGFFGMPIRFRSLAHQHAAPQCPALVNPSLEIDETVGGGTVDERARSRRETKSSVSKAWKSFTSGAVSCFGYVSPLGLTKLPKLFSDAFGLTRPVPDASTAGLTKSERGRRDVCIDSIAHETRVELAANALAGMSLTSDFARLVVIAGHGSSMVNNPHASGYDCGACGGRSGEPNARVAAAILNDADVRDDLRDRGIEIPDDTVFVAALHDTTTDDLELFATNVPDSHADDLNILQTAVTAAGRATRAERAPRLGIEEGVDEKIRARSRDWAQVRPEWGLAGATSFVVAPRSRTRRVDLEGKTFLHDYTWREDEGFGVLESIMTAPMVVTSWINLQYYASTVDNRVFGSGNKTLHNVVGTVGVLEGYAGDLRVGLPLQAVHDGEGFQHAPIRLKVVIEAPIDAMNQIIARHESVRQLVENGWIQLYAMNDEGEISHRYDGGQEWTLPGESSGEERMRASA